MPSRPDRVVDAAGSTAEPSSWAETDLDGATVLVTGGAGFIGRHLVDSLAPVADVRVLDSHLPPDSEGLPSGVATLEGDVTADAHLDAAMAGVDHVFHLAACSSVPETLERPTRSLEVNAVGTAGVLDRARRQDARVVVASSAAVYGSPAATPVPEDARLAPKSPYGIGKLAADRYARRYEEWYDVEAVALRFFNVYGPGQRNGVVATFVSRALAGQPLIIHGDGEQTRDFVHVDDVVRALGLAATTEATGAAYNVGTGEATSVRGLARLVQRATDDSVEVRHEDPRSADVEHSRAEVTRARTELGFEAEVDLADGVERLVAASR